MYFFSFDRESSFSLSADEDREVQLKADKLTLSQDEHCQNGDVTVVRMYAPVTALALGNEMISDFSICHFTKPSYEISV